MKYIIHVLLFFILIANIFLVKVGVKHYLIEGYRVMSGIPFPAMEYSISNTSVKSINIYHSIFNFIILTIILITVFYQRILFKRAKVSHKNNTMQCVIAIVLLIATVNSLQSFSANNFSQMKINNLFLLISWSIAVLFGLFNVIYIVRKKIMFFPLSKKENTPPPT